MDEHPTTAEIKETTYQRVSDFWQTYGVVFEQENGPGTFKYTFVDEMKQLHEDFAGGSHKTIILRKILDILAQQRTCMMQFECCLDEFNRYLAALRLLDTFIQRSVY
jgi:hypothetical protein